MASISISEDGFLRRISGGSGVENGFGARPGQKTANGIAGKRLSPDEYVASLPAQAAFIGGKTLETLTSLPPMPQQKPTGQAANGIGTGIGIGANNIGTNNAGLTGINAGIGTNKTAGGIGASVNTSGSGTIGTFGSVGIGTNKAGGTGLGINTGIGTNNTIGIGSADKNTTGAIGTFNTPNTDDEPIDTENTDENDETDDADKAKDEVSDNESTDKTDAELSPDEQSVVNELKSRDREVRAHEQAHISAGGAYIRGGASYQYQRGPDNKSYAVGGEVGIDTAPERDDPGATITKMQAVRAAALAPTDPSAQDRAVAASAARNESIARSDLAEKERNDEI